MKKNYVEPDMDVETFSVAEVVTTSSTEGDGPKWPTGERV